MAAMACRVLMGSGAEEIVRLASVPVLVGKCMPALVP
jgi:hypothetical protein